MMASPSSFVSSETIPMATQHQGRKHLQRLIRKVKHVLVIKHCIDDLKGGVGLQQCRGVLQKTDDIFNELPDGAATLSELRNLNGIANAFDGTVKTAKKECPVRDQLSKSIQKHLPEILPRAGTLRSLEAHLDRYIARTYENFRTCKQNVINTSRDFWIRWARKRGASIHDTRSQAIMVKLLDKNSDEFEQLYNLRCYLEAYIAGSFGRALESLSEVVSRLRAVFGIGWFFEWPSGRHPLNSTWPWADVKPSLLVLWGVCWMFYPDYGDFQVPAQSHRSSRQSGYNNVQYFQNASLPTQQPPSFQLGTFPRAGFGQPLLPGGGYLAPPQHPVEPNYTRQTQTMPGTMPWIQDSSIGHGFGRINATFENPTSHLVTTSSSVAYPQNHSYGYNVQRGAAPNGFGTFWNSRPNTRNVAEQASWLNQPDVLGENSSFKAASPHCINTRPIHNLQLPHNASASSTSVLMSSASAFNYPPLDNMNEMHDRPYMVGQERASYQMPDPHAYDHHHDPQQDQPRYPSPPPPLSENPYNAQQATGETPDSRLEMPMEPKSESDAPSPGRSKPVPKPDREVTKDANGRFFCNWPGCNEDIKDFGRKCEWSKHMDKHDRPYKCPADGCEKLPGFTYSGGLLRHEREVHNKHGGPRKQLNCPHPNCKRHTGKGFSRQENLNEHLRRVHTDTGLPLNGEETEDDANEAQAGGKRKRTRGDSADLREEMKRLKQENEELRRQAEAQTAQSAEMMRQIIALQQAQQLQAGMQHPRMQAPPAQMT